MQRVGLERLARIFFRHAARARARTKSIPMPKRENHDGREARPNLHRVKKQPLERFPDNVNRREKQQSGFDKRGKALDFAVTVEMLRVCRLVRHANRKIRDDRGDKVQNRMQRLGENSQAASDYREKYLQATRAPRRSPRNRAPPSAFRNRLADLPGDLPDRPPRRSVGYPAGCPSPFQEPEKPCARLYAVPGPSHDSGADHLERR